MHTLCLHGDYFTFLQRLTILKHAAQFVHLPHPLRDREGSCCLMLSIKPRRRSGCFDGPRSACVYHCITVSWFITLLFYIYCNQLNKPSNNDDLKPSNNRIVPDNDDVKPSAHHQLNKPSNNDDFKPSLIKCSSSCAIPNPGLPTVCVAGAVLLGVRPRGLQQVCKTGQGLACRASETCCCLLGARVAL